ncbi:PPK2 family polyphosphate:nucleotide phosphotransferase [Haloactinopolyspora alba]|uniref:PPK2 family polyphosphate:nucleotide phosphotransferase n=1 Tax=Haloactinopolyspora alba TaxID=648780 RepID=A0A2P8DIC3_9ACTN|nr:PPK2 family polyphosphate kinase [Haloactinopolyspora alba]PSK96975.1 PPK2 family polyphosphate:nucleotide phosphotransferase [Haloactinopolyspora alba]
MPKKATNPAEKRTWSQLLRVDPDHLELSALDTRATPGFDGGKSDGRAALQALEPAIDELQERLYAHGRTGGHRRLLLVLQGMDTSGKGGTMRKTVGLMDPQGVSIRAFGAPTPEERRRGFLWRIRQALPRPGQVGVFDRSHYEDVLAARVRKLSTPDVIERRYAAINAFEAELVESGCSVLKVMLHISRAEQKERLGERLENPEKHWKYAPSDLADRALWDEYQHAYELALSRCHTDAAPWHVVPADRKWYRNLAVAHLVVDRLRAMDLDWPPADFDVAAERAKLRAS